jgi:ectoine hydroxylase
MTTSDLARQFDQQGFLAVPQLFPKATVAALVQELDAWLGGEAAALPGDNGEYGRRFDVRVDVGVADGLAAAQALFASAAVLELTTQVLKEGWHTEGPPLIFSTPRNGQQGWHQDTSDVDPGHYMINRIIYPRQVVPEQGGLVVVPGSHRRGDLPPGGNHDDLEGQIRLLPAPGTLLFMHSRCWHRVQINDSDTPRTQVNWRARPLSAPENLGNNPVFRTGRWDFASASGA